MAGESSGAKVATKEAQVDMLNIRLPQLRLIDKIAPFILSIICLAVMWFTDSKPTVFTVLPITLILYAWRRYDSRILVGIGILLLIICATFLAAGREPYANEVAITAYYFLAMGVLGLFINYLRVRR